MKLRIGSVSLSNAMWIKKIIITKIYDFRFWKNVGVDEVLLIAGGEADGFGSRSSVEAFDGVNWKLVMKG